MAPDHVLADAGLTDVDAEFQEFAVDARGTPKRILPAHFSDQFSHVFWGRRPAWAAVTNLPSPEQLEALRMPGNHGFRFDDD
jgi:hypothetical protein